MSANRHLGRIIALQTLYEYDFRVACDDKNVSLKEILKRNLSRYNKAVKDVEFVKQLVDRVNTSSEKLDKTLQPVAKERPMSEIARMDRLILHIATDELLNTKDTPARVVINEAVELAKSFGGENSSKFINGALGALLAQIDPSQAKPAKDKEEKKDDK